MAKKSVQLVRVVVPDGPTDREHFDVVLAAKDRAVDLAADEREKTAQALAGSLTRALQDGDDRLREHVTNQVAQIEAALVSAERLELERIKSVRDLLTAALDSAKEAVTKSEAADHERFASHNNLLAKMDEQAKDSQSTLDKLTGSFVTKEAVAANREAWEEWRRSVERRFDQSMGERQGMGSARTEDRADRTEAREATTLRYAIVAALSSVATVILTLIVLIATNVIH